MYIITFLMFTKRKELIGISDCVRNKMIKLMQPMEPCRTCAKFYCADSINWIKLFLPNRFHTEIENIKLEFTTWNLLILENDGLPQKICADCFEKLCNYLIFRNECESAQLRLKALYAKDNMIHSRAHIKSEEISIQFPAILQHPTLESHVSTSSEIIEMVSSDRVESSPILKSDEENHLIDTIEHSNKEKIIQETSSSIQDACNKNLIKIITLESLEERIENWLTEQTKITNAHEEASEVIKLEPNDEIGIEYTKADNILSTKENLEKRIAKWFVNMPGNLDIEIKTPRDDPLYVSPPKGKHLQRNVRRLISQNPLACKYCASEDVQKLIYESKEALDAHLKQSHDPERPYNCPDCQKKYRDKSVLRSHIITKHLKRGCICEICGKNCIGHPAKLKRHMECYHTLGNYDCEMCGKQFKSCSLSRFNYHKRWHNPDQQYKCSHCAKVFIQINHLKVHEATHTGVNPHLCNLCGLGFKTTWHLRVHNYRKHGGKNPIKCPYCYETFPNYDAKGAHINKYHLKIVKSLDMVESPMYQKQFENDTKFDTHIKLAHEEYNGDIVHPAIRRIANTVQKNYKGSFRCDHCTKRFHLKRALLKHSAMHSTDGRPFACRECSLTFKQSPHLKMHMDSAHSNVKPYTCNICQKSFALNYVLRGHMKFHGEKSFKCSHCGKGFTHKKFVVSHERLHTGEKHYKCDLCPETFSQHGRLKGHMQKNHLRTSLDAVDNVAPSMHIQLELDDLIKPLEVVS